MSSTFSKRPVFRSSDKNVEDIRQTQGNQSEATKAVPFLHGKMRDNGGELFELASSATYQINHRLGRLPVGWMLLDYQADSGPSAPLYRISWDKTIITIGNPAGSTVRFRIWVW